MHMNIPNYDKLAITATAQVAWGILRSSWPILLAVLARLLIRWHLYVNMYVRTRISSEAICASIVARYCLE